MIGHGSARRLSGDVRPVRVTPWCRLVVDWEAAVRGAEACSSMRRRVCG